MLIENLWLKNPLVSFFTWTVKILDIFLSGWSNECVIQLLKCVISYAQACFSDLQPDWPKQTCQPMMYFYVCLCISIHFYIVAWDCWIYPEIHQFSDPTAAFFLAAVEFLGHELVPRASKAAGSSLGLRDEHRQVNCWRPGPRMCHMPGTIQESKIPNSKNSLYDTLLLG